MDEKTKKELHSAGATVRHKSIYSNLDVYKNEIEMDQSFRISG